MMSVMATFTKGFPHNESSKLSNKTQYVSALQKDAFSDPMPLSAGQHHQVTVTKIKAFSDQTVLSLVMFRPKNDLFKAWGTTAVTVKNACSPLSNSDILLTHPATLTFAFSGLCGSQQCHIISSSPTSEDHSFDC